MSTKTLKDLVRDEAAKLKANATEKELDRLDFDDFDPDDLKRCIYGQMAYHCRSNRAVQLLKKCAVSFSGAVDEDEWQTTPPENGFRPAERAWQIKVFSP